MKKLVALVALLAGLYYFLPNRYLLMVGIQRPYRPTSFQTKDLAQQWTTLPGCAGRPAFVYVWSKDCPACQQNLDFVRSLYERYRDTQLCFEAVAIDQSVPDIKRFVDDHHIEYPVYEGYGFIPADLWVGQTPWGFLIDRKGVVRKQLIPWIGAQGEIDSWLHANVWDGSPESQIKMAAKSPEVEAEYAENRDLTDRVQRLLSLGGFEELDALADDLRDKKVRSRWGQWRLPVFYSSLDSDLSTDEAYNLRIGSLEKWIQLRPQSITARLALVDVWVGYAWLARGSGESNTVTEAGNRLFKERLAKAHEVIDQAELLSTKTVDLYSVELHVARGESWDRAKTDEVFKKGVALEPLYTPLYRDMAIYLLPRWFGKDGEWERFAEQSAESAKEAGPALYSRIAWNANDYIFDRSTGRSIFTDSAIQWPKMRQGFMDIDQATQGSLVALNAFAWFACLAGDASTAKSIFERLGDRFDATIWASSYEYGLWKLWADGKRPPPIPVRR